MVLVGSWRASIKEMRQISMGVGLLRSGDLTCQFYQMTTTKQPKWLGNKVRILPMSNIPFGCLLCNK